MTTGATVPAKPSGSPNALPEFSLGARGAIASTLLPQSDVTSSRLRTGFVLALVTWLPLLLLTVGSGRLQPGSVAVPFLFDIEFHVRFLLVLPLLFVAELTTARRMRPLLGQFTARGLIPEGATPRFQAAIASAMRLRNSVAAEVLLIGVVYGIGILVVWRPHVALPVPTWYSSPTPDGSALTRAGLWYGYVSLPIFQFLLLRWYFRLFVWARFLWQVSRIDLALAPTHPDRVGGLSLLSAASGGFTVLALAHGALLAGWMATRIIPLGERLVDFKVEVALMTGFVLCITLGPLLLFVPQLAQAKRRGGREFGMLAARHAHAFEAKWLRPGAPAVDALLGTADIQTLSDLGNSYAVVRSMRITPVGRDVFLRIAIAVLVPIGPLLLTMIPLGELLRKLAAILL